MADEPFSLKLIDVNEMARTLGVPVSWLYQRTRTGTIPCVRVGKYVRFDPQEVLEFLRAKGSHGNAGQLGVS